MNRMLKHLRLKADRLDHFGHPVGDASINAEDLRYIPDRLAYDFYKRIVSLIEELKDTVNDEKIKIEIKEKESQLAALKAKLKIND